MNYRQAYTATARGLTTIIKQRHLSLLTTSPAAENTLSDWTDVADTQR